MINYAARNSWNLDSYYQKEDVIMAKQGSTMYRILVFTTVVAAIFALFIACSAGNNQEVPGMASTGEQKESTSTNSNKSDKLVLAIGEWAPYTTENAEGYGICTEVVTEVLKTIDINFEYRFYPWERALKMVESGVDWASFPWYYTEDRADVYHYSDDIWKSSHMLFYHKTSAKINNGNISYDKLEDLKLYKFGGVRGYFYEKIFSDEAYNYEMTGSLENVIQMLSNDRIDFFIEDEEVGWQAIKRILPDNVHEFDTLKKPVKEEKMYLLVSKKYPDSTEILKRFNDALWTIKANGKYQEILRRHGM